MLIVIVLFHNQQDIYAKILVEILVERNQMEDLSKGIVE